jgi:hypothetical protein
VWALCSTYFCSLKFHLDSNLGTWTTFNAKCIWSQTYSFLEIYMFPCKKTLRFVQVFCMLMQMYLCKNYDFSFIFFQASPCALQAFWYHISSYVQAQIVLCIHNVFVKVWGAFGYKNNVLLSLNSNQNLTYEILLEPK